MREVGFDLAYMFKYSERPGTQASKSLPDNIDETTKGRRLQELIDLQTGWSQESNRRDIGKTFEVLVEGVSKKSSDEMFGRSSQNKVIVFPAKIVLQPHSSEKLPTHNKKRHDELSKITKRRIEPDQYRSL